MSTEVVEGYSTFYFDKHGKPLSQEMVDKIMLLYHNRIERRCNEVGLTVEEEEQWDPECADIDVYSLSDSGEESEEHDMSPEVHFNLCNHCYTLGMSDPRPDIRCVQYLPKST
jgi:hypothetical protein